MMPHRDAAGRSPLALVALVAVLALVGSAFAGVGPFASTTGSASAPGADTVSLVPTTEVTPATDGVTETPARSGGSSDPETAASTTRPERARATFAGGCFWCMEPPFDRLDGVISTTSGFAGGRMIDPTYDQVASGATSHLEVVQVVYDPSRVSYTKLLETYWHNIDPTDDGGQFCDRGHQYTTAVFHHNQEQERLARASKERLKEWGGLPGPVVTDIRELEAFYAAESYHQNFYRTHTAHYERYRRGCRRDQRLRALWGEAAPH